MSRLTLGVEPQPSAQSADEPIAQRALLEEQFAGGIDEIGDVGGLLAAHQHDEFGRIGKPQFGGDVDDRVGEHALVLRPDRFLAVCIN